MKNKQDIEFKVKFEINTDGDYIFDLARKKQNNSVSLHAHGTIPILENSESLEYQFEQLLMNMSEKSTNWTLSKTTPNK